MKKVAVGIPIYNGSSFIEQALNSVYSQGDASWLEIVLVDDCSEDDSVEVVERWLEDRGNPQHVIFEKFRKNGGVAKARNRILELTTSDYIVFLDSDDLLFRNSLKPLQVLLIREPDLVYSPIYSLTVDRDCNDCDFAGVVEDVSGEQLGTAFYDFYRLHPKTGYFVDASCGIFYRVSLLRQYHLGYTEGMLFLEDGEFIGRVMAVAERCIFQENPLYAYRHNAGSANSRFRNRWSEEVLEGFYLGIQSLRSFRDTIVKRDDQHRMLNLVIAKYSLLPYQSVFNRILFSYQRHSLVHASMQKMGFYPIPENFDHFQFSPMVRMINFSVWRFYAFYWITTCKGYLVRKFRI